MGLCTYIHSSCVYFRPEPVFILLRHSSSFVRYGIFRSLIKVQFEADFNRNGMKTSVHLTQHKAETE